jgi:hypothetical protein
MDYGWWSPKQTEHGYYVWKTASGEEVYVTLVTPTLEHGTEWKDIEYVGEVKTFVRRIPGTIDQGQRFNIFAGDWAAPMEEMMELDLSDL